METQNQINQESNSSLDNAIDISQDYILSLQHPEGYWVGELESNVTLTAETVLLYKIWGFSESLPNCKIKAYLCNQQKKYGGWELFYGDGGEISTSIEAYMALRLLGMSKEDSILVNAKKFILSKGGISKARIF